MNTSFRIPPHRIIYLGSVSVQFEHFPEHSHIQFFLRPGFEQK